jgi:hypothetical protein
MRRLFSDSQTRLKMRASGVEAHSMIGYGAVMPTDSAAPRIPAEWLADFEAAARRPLKQRFRYAFIHTHKPVMDDARFRAWDTMEEYRQWCEENLPSWLGYGRV